MYSRKVVTLLVLVFVTGLFLTQVASVDSSTTGTTAENANTERAQRAEIRAFYTAPPQIPHELMPTQSDCQFCHDEVREIQGKLTVKTPHPEKTNCMQCHMAATTPLGPPDQALENSFKGLEEPRNGDRWSAVSPPTIPHRNFMRENCASCHDGKSPYEYLRTPHNERGQCYQCHVSAANAEFTLTAK